MKEMKGRCKTGHVQQSEAFGRKVASSVPRGAARSPAPSSRQSRGTSLAAGSPPALYGESHPACAWGCAGAGSLSPALPGQESPRERGKPHGETRHVPAADRKGSGAEPSEVERGGEGARGRGRKQWGQSRERTAIPSSPGPDGVARGAAGMAPAQGRGRAGRRVVWRRSPFSPDSAAWG